MTCRMMRDKFGYRGQSHEIWATWPNGERKRLGWANSAELDGWASLAKAWRLTHLEAVEIKKPAEVDHAGD